MRLPDSLRDDCGLDNGLYVEDAQVSHFGFVYRGSAFTYVSFLLHYVELIDIRSAFRKPVVISLIGSNDVCLTETENAPAE